MKSYIYLSQTIISIYESVCLHIDLLMLFNVTNPVDYRDVLAFKQSIQVVPGEILSVWPICSLQTLSFEDEPFLQQITFPDDQVGSFIFFSFSWSHKSIQLTFIDNLNFPLPTVDSLSYKAFCLWNREKKPRGRGSSDGPYGIIRKGWEVSGFECAQLFENCLSADGVIVLRLLFPFLFI